ncbi:hypothetical protein SALBM135S_00294 [Streptomyces alboniger]
MPARSSWTRTARSTVTSSAQTRKTCTGTSLPDCEAMLEPDITHGTRDGAGPKSVGTSAT